MSVGMQEINAYGGRAYLDVRQLFEARSLDLARFDNLMMEQKSVNLPCEDAVSNAVNAARPIVDALSVGEKERIELVIVATESGLDFGKPISTYVHHYLSLGCRCRSFEVKHACYGGTAALQMAAAFVDASPIPGVAALVIASDAASMPARGTYWEPSQGAGAVAMLVSGRPDVLELDPGACGYYSYEVMDTLRPRPDLETGDSDQSLLSYLRCLEESYGMYRQRVGGGRVVDPLDYLVFHSPFAGMVKAAHRMLLRKQIQASPKLIEEDFQSRVAPSLRYCTRVGNTYSAALYFAFCSLVDHGTFDSPKRVGMFSYGSGCASEFYSGVVAEGAREKLAAYRMGLSLDERYPLSMEEYEPISDANVERMCGVRNRVFDTAPYRQVYDAAMAGRGLLVLDEIVDFHRRYRWS